MNRLKVVRLEDEQTDSTLFSGIVDTCDVFQFLDFIIYNGA